jgi:hypothetical protein
MASKSDASATATGAAGNGRAAWHFPHCVGRSIDGYLNRFRVPHAAHVCRMPVASGVNVDIHLYEAIQVPEVTGVIRHT